MKGYWLILGTEITDQTAQNEYNKLWAPISEKYQARLNPTMVPPLLREWNVIQPILPSKRRSRRVSMTGVC